MIVLLVLHKCKQFITKHIALKLFYSHELQEVGKSICCKQSIVITDKIADLFTKSLSHTTFQIFVFGIGMR